MKAPKCKNSISTSAGKVLIVDDGGNNKVAMKYCEKRSSLLAPIKTRDILEEIAYKLFTCENVNGVLQNRERFEYRVGLGFLDGTTTWSDGTGYNPGVHDTVEQAYKWSGEHYFLISNYTLSVNLHSHKCAKYYFKKEDKDFASSFEGIPGLRAYTCDSTMHNVLRGNNPFLCMPSYNTTKSHPSRAWGWWASCLLNYSSSWIFWTALLIVASIVAVVIKLRKRSKRAKKNKALKAADG